MARPRFLILVFGLGAALLATGCVTTGPANLSDVESVDFVVQDLTRWDDMPGFDLPRPRFIESVAEGRTGSGTGEPNIPTIMRWAVDQANGDVSTVKVEYQQEGGPKHFRYASYLGPFQMSTKGFGVSPWSRRFLDFKSVGRVPLDDAIARRAPELHGIDAAQFNQDFRWKIVVNPGSAADRWFDISTRIRDVDTIEVEINGKPYVLDAYVLEYSLKNVHALYKRELMVWYIPVIGWVGKIAGKSDSRGSLTQIVLDRVSFQVDERDMPEITKYAR